MKVFGYPEFDENGVMPVTQYDGEYAGMMMDIFLKKLDAGETIGLSRSGEEVAALLLSGDVTFRGNDKPEDELDNECTCSRESVFVKESGAVHVCTDRAIEITANKDSEILVQCTKNEREFPSKFYEPKDSPWSNGYPGKFGDVANRGVNTIFDHDICPESNMVLGEILNKPGNGSGYLPHQHPQPEVYFFKFDRPEGFGASFVGDDVYKSVNNSFSAIPGGKLHPQSAAPGFTMWTCWMIRHFDDNPWLQTDRCEDERYTWLHDAEV